MDEEELARELTRKYAPEIKESIARIRADSGEFFGEVQASIERTHASTLLFVGWTEDQLRTVADTGDEDAAAILFWLDSYRLGLLDTEAQKRGVTEDELRAEIDSDPAGFVHRETAKSLTV
jgi:hypothetical protein